MAMQEAGNCLTQESFHAWNYWADLLNPSHQYLFVLEAGEGTKTLPPLLCAHLPVSNFKISNSLKILMLRKSIV